LSFHNIYSLNCTKKGGENMAKTKKITKINQQLPQQAKRTVKQTAKKLGRKGGTAMVGGAAGALVGAAVGGAAGVALVDKKARVKMGKALNEFSETAAKTIDTVNEKVTGATDSARQTLDEVSEGTQRLQKQTQRIRE
jgi:hypothetical protein